MARARRVRDAVALGDAMSRIAGRLVGRGRRPRVSDWTIPPVPDKGGSLGEWREFLNWAGLDVIWDFGSTKPYVLVWRESRHILTRWTLRYVMRVSYNERTARTLDEILVQATRG